MSQPEFVPLLHQYLDAGYPCLWINTHEDDRLVRELLAGPRKRQLFDWNAVTGLRQLMVSGQPVVPDTARFRAVLDHAAANSSPQGLYLLRDPQPYLQDPVLRRHIRNLLPVLKTRNSTLLLLSPSGNIPEDLVRDLQVVDYGLPGTPTLATRLEVIRKSVNEGSPEKKPKFPLAEDIRQAAVEASLGLTWSEAENAFALAMVRHRSFSREFVRSVFEEKVAQVRKHGLLTYLAPDTDFSKVGGLAGLKHWITLRGKAYRPEARQYGLPYPKGILLCGVPGTGKTLLAKAVSAELGLPLFQLDVGGLFSGLVGATEANFRRVIQTVDGLGPCILYIDELEKSLSRQAVSGQGDTGTSSRSFGTLLTWLSDHRTPVFVIATSNNFTVLPPELIRKGRFDDLFWVDLPDAEDRNEIFQVQLANYGRTALLGSLGLAPAVRATTGFTGAEIEQVVVAALFRGFNENGREINVDDLVAEANNVTPLSRVNSADLAQMRSQAAGRLRQASADGTVSVVPENLRALVV